VRVCFDFHDDGCNTVTTDLENLERYHTIRYCVFNVQ